MPYIDSYKQHLLDDDIKKLIKKLVTKEIDYGAIEYVFFKILAAAAESKMRFANLNSLTGVLETTKLEFADKFLRPYEDKKLLDSFINKQSKE